MLSELIDIFKESRVKKKEKNFLLFSCILIGISTFINIDIPLGQELFFLILFAALLFLTTKKIMKCTHFIEVKMKISPNSFLFYLWKRLYFYLITPCLVFIPNFILAILSLLVPIFDFSITLWFLFGSVICLKSLVLINNYEDVLEKVYDYKK